MPITTGLLARSWHLSRGRASRCAREMGLAPIGRQGIEHVWSLSQAFAGLIPPHLSAKAGVPRAAALEAARIIGSLTDERLEQLIRGGCHYVAAVGGRPLLGPVLYHAASVELVRRERADVLRELGLTLIVLDVKPLWVGLRAQIRAWQTGAEPAEVTDDAAE